MATNNNPLLNCPPLRFPDFSDPWQQSTLGELLEFFPTNSLSWEQLNYSSGNIYNIHYGLIHKELPIICSPTSSKLPYINEEIETGRYCFCKSGDLVIADASEDTHDVGKAIELVDCDKVKVLAGLHTIHARSSKDKIAIGFKGYLFASNNLREQIKRVAQGTKVYSISSKLISPLKTSFPSLDEQRKIAEFLSLIDERIETQRQTIEERKKQKKALLHQIFTQSLRFPEFSGPWREYPCLDLFNVVTERNKSLKRSLVLSASQSLGMVSREDIGIDIKYREESLSTYKYINRGDYVIHLRSFQGGFAFSDQDGICSPAYTVLRPTSKLYYGFLSEYFKSSMFINSLVDVTYGIRDGRSISVDEWMKGSISLPSLEEQRKIAELLAIFDERIEAEEALLKCYESQKRYLLRQMFA